MTPARPTPILAANWKMNHGPTEARDFMRAFLDEERVAGRTIIFFPPALALEAVVNALRGREGLTAGVQNIHWEPKGAFTGELSAEMAADAGASFVLVGHSERRHGFGETDEDTRRKCVAAARAGLRPVLCVGETLAEREAGATEQVVLRQLRAAVDGLARDRVATMLVAYEPVWAIGTGRTATPADASATHRVIREALSEIGGDGAQQVPVLYGGSVNPKNASALLGAPHVDGLLVGGASLEPRGWAAITRA
jgi:triosephosphate isomerase (TIM)